MVAVTDSQIAPLIPGITTTAGFAVERGLPKELMESAIQTAADIAKVMIAADWSTGQQTAAVIMAFFRAIAP